MNSEKILYWVALGALVIGISHEYRDGKFPAAHRAITNTENQLCHLVTRAEQTMAMAKLIIHPSAAATDEVALSAANVSADVREAQAEMIRERAQEQAEMARAQAEMVRDQVQARAEMIRAQAELRRAHFEQLRQLTESRFHFSRAADRRVELVCPKTGKKIFVKVNVPEAPEAPEVEVSDNF